MRIQPIDSPEKARLYLSLLEPDRRERLQATAFTGFDATLRRASQDGTIAAGPVEEMLDKLARGGFGEWL